MTLTEHPNENYNELADQTQIGKRISKNGSDGVVYSVSENLVAKVYHGSKDKKGFNKDPLKLKHEHEMLKLAYLSKISVPYSRGIFGVRIEDCCDIVPGIVMGKIKEHYVGTILTLENWGLWEHVKKLRSLELKKAGKKGFVFGEDVRYQGNVLYVPEKDKIYLIDLKEWNITDRFKHPLE